MDTTTKADVMNQNSSTLINVKDQDQRSEKKSQGSFGNAGSLLSKLFKKKDNKEGDINRMNSNDSFSQDIAQLKGEARHLNLGANKQYKSKVIQDRWEKQR